MNPWVAINERFDRVAVKLRRRLADLERLGPILLGLLVAQERQRAAKKGSFFHSRQAATLRQKHRHPAPVRRSSCACFNSSGTRVRKAVACPTCRDSVVKVICRTSGSGLVLCQTPDGVRVSFAGEKEFREWCRGNGVRVE